MLKLTDAFNFPGAKMHFEKLNMFWDCLETFLVIGKQILFSQYTGVKHNTHFLKLAPAWYTIEYLASVDYIAEYLIPRDYMPMFN